MDIVTLPNPPLIPDLVFRRFRGARDLPGIAAVHQSRVESDQLDPLAPGQRPPTVAELAEIYRPRLDFAPDRQMLMAEVRGRLVGYAWIRSWEDADSSWVLFHRLLLAPNWRGKGIGAALMLWAESALAEIASRRPAGTGALFRSDVYSSEREMVARLEAAGYTIGHSDVEMALPSLAGLPEAPTPDGFDVRAPQPDETRAAYFALEAAFADEWGYTVKTDDDFNDLMQAPKTDPSLWRIAIADGQIAGVIVCEASVPSGTVSDLSVGAAWRRRGLGRALLLAGLHALRERGLTEARVYTDSDNPFGARTLYESIGFRVTKEVRRYVKPM